MLKIIKLGLLLGLLIGMHACDHDEKEEEVTPLDIYIDKPRITSASKVTAYKDESIIMIVTAADMNREDLDYYIKGDDSQYFTINTQTGEIQFRVVPNYEEGTSYNIIVGAKDFSRNTGEMHVEIRLSTDIKPVEEPRENDSNFDFTLSVTVDRTKSDGTNWDVFGGAPDIRILIDDIVHDGKCQDSFNCSFQFSSKQTQWNIRVVDQDISLHDNIGEGKCDIGTTVIGQSIIDILQNN